MNILHVSIYRCIVGTHYQGLFKVYLDWFTKTHANAMTVLRVRTLTTHVIHAGESEQRTRRCLNMFNILFNYGL